MTFLLHKQITTKTQLTGLKVDPKLNLKHYV